VGPMRSAAARIVVRRRFVAAPGGQMPRRAFTRSTGEGTRRRRRMSRSTCSGPDNSTARAFVHVGWTKLLAKLHRYATGTLRLAAIDADRADVVEAVDLVNTLVAKSLDGTLTWNLPAHATDEEVVGYACNKLYGMRATLRRKAALTLHDDSDALDEQADEAPDALEQLVEQTTIANVMQAFAHDVEASAHIKKMLAGKRRAEIVDELGCTPEQADVVRKRIVRGIAALGARINNEREDEPPSSGPRESYHEPKANKERQGAPPEPHRCAGGARRRR